MTAARPLDLEIRPIRPEDEGEMRRFHAALSDRSVYFRYLHPYKLSTRSSHDRLVRICASDGGADAVFAAVAPGEAGAIVAVGRLSLLDDASAEMAAAVADAWQGRGVGTAMARKLLEEARRRGCGRVLALIHRDNDPMRKLCSKLGFAENLSPGNPLVRAELRP